MPDLTTAPPTLGSSSSQGKIQSQRGGKGRFDPSGRGNRGGRGRGGRDSRQGGAGSSRPHVANVQHPGHIPGSLASRPLNGVFGIDKPSGKTCMELLDSLKDLLACSPLFRNPDGTVPEGHGGKAWRPKNRKQFKGQAAPPKIGQGGTLDPLASGALVIGLGSGTKELQGFLDCAKTYETIGLLGASTTSYDSQDPIMKRTAHQHVTEELISSYLPYFTGPLLQYPPLFSAVKMDGKRLFDYARQNLPLPRPIEPREIEVLEIALLRFMKADQHAWKYPEKEIPEEDKKLIGRVKEMAGQKDGQTETVMAEGGSEKQQKQQEEQERVSDESGSGPSEQPDPEREVAPAAFRLRMSVSSGTYVRSIVHDVGLACSSSAHVVELRRTRQGAWITQEEADRLNAEAQPSDQTTSAPAGALATEPSKDALPAQQSSDDTTISVELKDDLLPDSQSLADQTAPTQDSGANVVEAAGQNAEQMDAPASKDLIVLPWSIFEQAIAEQAQDPDPNLRCSRLRSNTSGKQQVELKEWEKQLLKVLQPC
ncbi:unnamed protein product [Parajaminaea phylloscopi]